MKTAVSIPTDLFRKADRLAKRLKKSRSALYAEAVREYLARHDPRATTDAINRDIAEHGQPVDDVWLAAGLDAARKLEW